jgi:hypothetical protein
MAETPPDSNVQAGVRNGREKQPPATPRWVIAFGIVVIVLVVVFLIVHFTGLMPMHTSMHG